MIRRPRMVPPLEVVVVWYNDWMRRIVVSFWWVIIIIIIIFTTSTGMVVVTAKTTTSTTTTTTTTTVEESTTRRIDPDTIRMIQHIWYTNHHHRHHPQPQQYDSSRSDRCDQPHTKNHRNTHSDDSGGGGGLIWNHLTVVSTTPSTHHHYRTTHSSPSHTSTTNTTTATSTTTSNHHPPLPLPPQHPNHHHHHNNNADDNDDDDVELLLQDTSGIIRNGRVVGIIGPSGSGKTVFLQAILQSSSSTSSWQKSSSSSTDDNDDDGSSQSRRHRTVYHYQYHDDDHHKNQKSLRNPTNTTFQPRNICTFQSIPSHQMAYISQTDHDNVFFDQLTVYETLQLTSFLEAMTTSHSSSTATKDDRKIQSTIQQLGLQHVTHRKVGSSSSSGSSSSASSSRTRHGGGGSAHPWIYTLRSFFPRMRQRQRGRTWWWRNTMAQHPHGAGRLSGGERRRLSVGLELGRHDDLKVILADEPTSGLDSTYSRIVLTLIRTLAQTRNIPAVVTIHQPSSYIWNHLLDDIILLAPGGYVCYHGRRDTMISYFAQLGYPVPDYTNPSEYFMDLVSIHTENQTQSRVDQQRIRQLYTSFQQYQQEQLSSLASLEQVTDWIHQQKLNVSFIPYSALTSLSNVNAANATNGTKHRPLQYRLAQLPLIRSLRRIMALFRRSWRQNIRHTTMNTSRFWISIGNALLLAGVFPSIQKGSRPLISSIADRVALLSFACINLCMMTYMKTITLFAQERPVVERELQIRQQYTVLEYLVAKVTSELPIDMIFSMIFAVILKYCTGLQISLRQLSQVFALLTTAGASLGFVLGSTASSHQYATTAGIPVLVLLMVVGVINPSGVDVTKPKPILLRYLKQISPFAYAIEALCIAEYRGVQFYAARADASNSGGGGGIGRTIGSFVSRLKDAPRMGGLAMITVRCVGSLFF